MFRGYLRVGASELANTSRLLAHIHHGVPVTDAVLSDPLTVCSACVPHVGYDDSWPGLQAVTGGDYVVESAPWYDPSVPESAEFAGVWLMDAQGFESAKVSRDIAESVCVGGVPGRARLPSQSLSFSALLVACSDAGVRYGITWLTCVLRQADSRTGVTIEYYAAHPSGTSATPESLRREMRGVVMTSSPTLGDVAGKGGGHDHRQATAYRVDWEMAATDPYAYASPISSAVIWESVTEDPITWAHAPDCVDTQACGLPTMYNASCEPPTVPVVSAAIPTCSGCLPVCAVERRVWTLTGSTGAVCDDTVVTVSVANLGDDPLTVSLYWRPCGEDALCDREAPLQIAGLPVGYTAVADSMTGRPYLESEGITYRQVGIVGTPTGAPWRPTTLDTTMCWELVAESAIGAEYDVTVVQRGRYA